MDHSKPHIVLIIPRGESVRNFLYSDTLATLRVEAQVTLLSAIHDERFMESFSPIVDRIIPIRPIHERPLVVYFRSWLHEAHFRWLQSEVAKNEWHLRDAKAKMRGKFWQRQLAKVPIQLVANRPTLEVMTEFDRYLSWRLRPSDEYVELFNQLKPDLVFNGSHIHGPAGELPAKIAHRLGYKTAGFIFSWDNLTSRSRIYVPYHDYLVWHAGMKRQLLSIYPKIDPGHVHITGTPQFDFHFKDQYNWSREELCRQIGIDPARPFILYTTGIDKHFPEEHRTVEFVVNTLEAMPREKRPQLVVRTYVKGTSREMYSLAERGWEDVCFPKVSWDAKWVMPLPEDSYIYTNLLKHCAFGINAASTVSLELMIHDKPVINLALDPPGSQLPEHLHWIRHIRFDHYQPVAASGGVMVANNASELANYIEEALDQPSKQSEQRRRFISETFGDTLDGKSGQRVAEKLLSLAGNSHA